jgi:hypothetical protein
MRPIILGGIAVGILAGTVILSSECAEAQYSTEKGQGLRSKKRRKSYA